MEPRTRLMEDLKKGAFTDGEVINYQGDNYYRACGAVVTIQSYCVKRVNHPGVLHEDYDGNVRGNNNSSISSIASPDASITTNEKGGSQSHIPVRFDLIDALALFEMAKVLHHGAEKYGEDNWRLIPVKEHLNHLLMHAYAYLSGDETDEHLSHIMCRATFAQGVALSEGVKIDPSN